MVLPALDKTWQFNVNNVRTGTVALDDSRAVLRGIKNRFIGFASNPWVVDYSCNSTVAGTPGDGVDRWAADTDLVFQSADTGTARSWIVLRNPVTTMELLIECRSSTTSTGRGIRVVVSPSAGFTGGTTTSRPTATDELILYAGDINSTWGWGTISSNTVVNSVYHVFHSSDGQVTYVVICIGSRATGFWCFGRPIDPPAGWTNPQIAIMSGGTATLGPSSLGLYYTDLFFNGTNTAFIARTNSVAGGGTCYITTEALRTSAVASSPVSQNLLVVNELTSEWEVYPCNITCITPGSRGRVGRLADLRYVSEALTSGDTAPGDGSRTRAVFGNVMFPWNGTVPIVS